MAFLTDLQVRRDSPNESWVLTEPLVWEGDWETLYIKPGFITDFASVPKIVRWLLDSGGRNAAPGVLHDAVWRESKRKGGDRRVDPWHADGMFRRALRRSKLPPIPRNMIWVGVRLAAILSGRLGKKGPSWFRKVLAVLMWTLIGVVIVTVPLIAIVVGYSVYWIFGLMAAIATAIYTWYRRRGSATYEPAQTLPRFDLGKAEARRSSGYVQHLLVISKPSDAVGERGIEQMVAEDSDLSELLARYLVDYVASGRTLSWRDSEEACELQNQTQR